MAKGLNKWTGIGNLGADPIVRYQPDGTAHATISLGCGETWKDKQSGERKERTEWIRVVFWRKLAEIAGEYLKKGSKVYIEGKLTNRKWNDNGQDKYITEIVASHLLMLSYNESPNNSQNQAAPSSAPADQQADMMPAGDFDDDIPF